MCDISIVILTLVLLEHCRFVECHLRELTLQRVLKYIGVNCFSQGGSGKENRLINLELCHSHPDVNFMRISLSLLQLGWLLIRSDVAAVLNYLHVVKGFN